jgi:hypothetical protein
MSRGKRSRRPWFVRHSLSLVAAALLLLWIGGYLWLDPKSHLGVFCGNAVADWSGSLMIILGTKYFYEAGSEESRPLRGGPRNSWLALLQKHSLLIFILLTGIIWTVVFLKMKPDSRWGEVVGNLVSEWCQMAGLVFLTKELMETGSKESKT